MPISRKDFWNGKFEHKEPRGSNYVLNFLSKDKRAWTVEELAKKFKKSKSAIRHQLKPIVKKGLVVSKTPYFTAKLENHKKKPTSKHKPRS